MKKSIDLQSSNDVHVKKRLVIYIMLYSCKKWNTIKSWNPQNINFQSIKSNYRKCKLYHFCLKYGGYACMCACVCMCLYRHDDYVWMIQYVKQNVILEELNDTSSISLINVVHTLHIFFFTIQYICHKSSY